MNNNFNLSFWKKDYAERFQLDREGQEILNYFVQANPDSAKKFIKDKYERQVCREDIIDKYSIKYDSKKINQILNEMEYKKLTKEEIDYYEIVEEEEM